MSNNELPRDGYKATISGGKHIEECILLGQNGESTVIFNNKKLF